MLLDLDPNVGSSWGSAWTRIQSDSVSFLVILLTPALRNMDQAHVSRASAMRAILKAALPALLLVTLLRPLHAFSGLGAPWGSHSLIVVSSLTIVIVAVIFLRQAWSAKRPPYTALSTGFIPGLIDIGRWKWAVLGGVVFLFAMFTVLPLFVVLVGSFGAFQAAPLWTTRYWADIVTQPDFWTGLRTTTILAFSAGVGGPLLFSLLVYVLASARWRGKRILDAAIWASAVFHGFIFSLGLLLTFTSVPGLDFLFGSIWPMILVVIVAGNAVGTVIFRGIMGQLGNDVEEAVRIAGVGWFGAYFRIVIPLLLPTMVLIGTLSFISAASTTSNIILLASRDTTTLSILRLEWASLELSPELGRIESAGIATLVITAYTLIPALVGRYYALKIGRHRE